MPYLMLQRFIALLGVALIGLAVVSCGGPVPQIHPLSQQAVVVAFGDSLTYGTGAEPGESYPEQLQSLIGRTVVNAGVPGEVSAEGLRRLPRILDKYEPRLLLLCHGGNDLLRKQDPEALRANLLAMVLEAQDRNIDVVMLAVPKPAIFLSSLDIYAEVAAEAGVPIETEIIADVISDNLLKSDRVHPNGAGYRQIAEAVFELLREAGAVR